MGKHLQSPIKIEACARIASQRVAKPTDNSLPPKTLISPSQKTQKKLEFAMNEGTRAALEARVPLSEVVADCVKRWFQDALKEARNGDQGMQVLVGQMYQNGYGVARNEQKAKVWIGKASRYRPSVWKVFEKHPGYNASDSDSDEVKDGKGSV